MDEPTTPTPFERACRVIGSYAAVGQLFTPKVSPQAVSKWADEGVPPGRVLTFAAAADYVATPHELRPDLYPYPDDGLPIERRRYEGRAAA